MSKVQSKNAILFDVVNDAGPLRDALVGTIGEATTTEPGLMAGADKEKLDGIATNSELRDRTTHTGEQSISTITGLVDALAEKATAAQGTKADTAVQPGAAVSVLAETSIAKIMSGDERTKLGALPDNASLNSALAERIALTEKGVANGVATLGADSKVPAGQLPSYVDDVLEYADYASLPVTGEAGKIYVTLDTNNQYRWAGSSYVEIVASPGSTDEVAEGVSNLYHTAARVRDTVLAGLSVATDMAITATDSVLSAVGKLQAQVTGLAATKFDKAGGTITGSVLPDSDNARNIGSASARLANTYTANVRGLDSVFGQTDSGRVIIGGGPTPVAQVGGSGGVVVRGPTNASNPGGVELWSGGSPRLTLNGATGKIGFSTRPEVSGAGDVETQNNKGVANGYAPLGADNLVPSSYLPVSGSYKGSWNASTNTPTLTTTPSTNGDYYIVSAAGTQSVTGSSTAFAIGDQLRSNGTAWQRIPSVNAISSVFGRTGIIVSANGDYNATQITYGETTVALALDAKAPLASPALTGTPTAPTAAVGTNTTQIATMAAVKAAIDDITVISGGTF